MSNSAEERNTGSLGRIFHNGPRIQTLAMLLLAGITAFYASVTCDISNSTKRQADHTAKLAEETANLRLAAFQPIVLATWKPMYDEGQVEVTVENFGPGLALNVSVSMKVKELTATAEIEDRTLTGQPHIRRLRSPEEPESTIVSLEDVRLPEAVSEGFIVIRYSDIENNRFITEIALDVDLDPTREDEPLRLIQKGGIEYRRLTR